MRILFTNTGPRGTVGATVVDAVSLEMMRGRRQVSIVISAANSWSVYHKNIPAKSECLTWYKLCAWLKCFRTS